MQWLALTIACLMLIGGWADEARCDPPGAAAAAPAVGPAQLFRSLAASSVRASRAAQHLIGIESDWNAEASAAQEQAALAVAQAFVTLAAEPDGQAAMDRVNIVRIAPGRRPAASLSGNILVVTVTTQPGAAGWPPTDQVLAALRSP